MQEFQYREPLHLPSEKGKGIVGTLVIHCAVIVLLVLVSFSVPPPPEQQEGIIVNFGTDETGFGNIEPSPPPGPPNTTPLLPAQKEASAPHVKSSPKRSSGETPLLSQDKEDGPEVKKADPAAEKKRNEKIEADKKIKEELEADRIRKKQEDDERKKAEAEQQRQSDILNKTKNALANARNTGTGSTSEGVAGGTGNQGDPRGSVDSNVHGVGGNTGNGKEGVSYKLQGRNFQKLPKPNYDYQGDGIVVVEVTVDKNGKVIQAVPGIKGSTTLDEYLLRVAKEAAMNASFDAKPDAPLQKGSITYIFKLK